MALFARDRRPPALSAVGRLFVERCLSIVTSADADDEVRVNEVMIATRVERAARPGVVPSEQFGAAIGNLLQSGVRGQQLELQTLERFGAAR